MSDSIDKPGTTNPGSRTPAVEEAPESPSGTDLTMETLDTISAGGDVTVREIKMRQELADERHFNSLDKSAPTLSGEEATKLFNDTRPSIGVKGVSGT